MEKNVEVVPRFNEAHDGEDIIPLLRAGLERVGANPEPTEVLSFWADDPAGDTSTLRSNGT